MSNQYFNFYYDPVRQGYDTSIWRTLYGDVPRPTGNSLLVLPQSAFIHYGDILRGDAVFGMNLPAPAVGYDNKFGFLQINKNTYAYFKITNSVLSAETSNGTTTDSETITWQDAWTNTNTEFRIQWEAGTATFYIGGISQAVIQNVSVSGDPLSLYVSNGSVDTLLLNYINVKSIQSYILHEALEDSGFAPIISESDRVTITESVEMFIPTLFVNNGIVPDTLTLTESITMLTIILIANNGVISDSPTLTESVTVAVI